MNKKVFMKIMNTAEEEQQQTEREREGIFISLKICGPKNWFFTQNISLFFRFTWKFSRIISIRFFIRNFQAVFFHFSFNRKVHKICRVKDEQEGVIRPHSTHSLNHSIEMNFSFLFLSISIFSLIKRLLFLHHLETS